MNLLIRALQILYQEGKIDKKTVEQLMKINQLTAKSVFSELVFTLTSLSAMVKLKIISNSNKIEFALELISINKWQDASLDEIEKILDCDTPRLFCYGKQTGSGKQGSSGQKTSSKKEYSTRKRTGRSPIQYKETEVDKILHSNTYSEIEESSYSRLEMLLKRKNTYCSPPKKLLKENTKIKQPSVLRFFKRY